MTAHDHGSHEHIYDTWLRDERSEKRGLRLSLAAAAVLHGALLLMVVPEYTEVSAAPIDEGKFFVVETPRFKKPPPPPTDVTPPPTRIPMPDPDPFDPEPFIPDDELAPPPALADIDDAVFFSFPDAPPAPPEPADRVYRVGEVDPPERIHYVEPRYTELARRIRLEGVVIVQATIDKEGDVVDIQVLRGMSMGLTEATVEAVRQWKFRPSTVDSRPVAVLYTLTVHFSLR